MSETGPSLSQTKRLTRDFLPPKPSRRVGLVDPQDAQLRKQPRLSLSRALNRRTRDSAVQDPQRPGPFREAHISYPETPCAKRIAIGPLEATPRLDDAFSQLTVSNRETRGPGANDLLGVFRSS